MEDIKRSNDPETGSSGISIQEDILKEIDPLREIAPPKRSWQRRVLFALGKSLLSLIVIASILFSLGYFYFKQKISRSASSAVENFRLAAEDLKSFDINKAREEMAKGSQGVEELSDDTIVSFFTAFPTFLDAIGIGASSFSVISTNGLGLVKDIDYLNKNWPELLFDKKGEEVLATSKRIRDNINALYDSSLKFSPLGGGSMIGDILSLKVDLLEMRNFVNIFDDWLRNKEAHHLIVFLGNVSELRPGGGFLGSYAEVTIKEGSLENIEVKNISETDKDLDLKLTPPLELQTLVKRWRAADANWFFDFPLSAKKTLDLMEASNYYKERNVSFDGAIEISSDVVTDILSLTGPVKLSSGKEINQENFLSEVQKDIQEKQDVGSTRSKEILQELNPILIEKMRSLPEDKRNMLGNLLVKWIAKKEAMVYFKDQKFAKFFKDLGLDGSVYQELPQSGDYIAVVNANVGGGKTDIYMKQKISLESQIGVDGKVNNHLTITREHLGNKSKYWWYQVPNKDYMMVFTPDESRIIYAAGGESKRIIPKVDYIGEGFSQDKEVASVERTKQKNLTYPFIDSFKESGKKVFGTWVTTEMGNTSSVTLDYERDMQTLPKDGSKYQFVFERQSGAEENVSIRISAPVGFRFEENGLPIFEYESDDPDGRNIFDLTLRKVD